MTEHIAVFPDSKHQLHPLAYASPQTSRQAPSTGTSVSHIREQVRADGNRLPKLTSSPGQPQLYLPYSTGRGGLCEAIKVSGARGRTWFVGEDNIAGASRAAAAGQPAGPRRRRLSYSFSSSIN